MPLAAQDAAAASAVPDPRRELVERIVASESFAKSKRLADFLVFICTLTLQGEASKLNEQTIGEEVFGRSAPYDSANDGIVRVQASRLRQRLESYFEGEGILEPVKVIVPRGSYVPVFEVRREVLQRPELPPSAGEAAPLRSLPAEQIPHPGEFAARPSKRLVVGWPVAALLVVIAALSGAWYASWHSRSVAAALPTPGPLWSGIFVAGENTIVVPGDTGLVIWENLTGRTVTLDQFVQGAYRDTSQPREASSDKFAGLLSNQRYTTIVDLDIAQALSRVATTMNHGLEVRFARDVVMNELHEDNVVLIGAPQANPWVSLYEPILNFRFATSGNGHRFFIENRQPQGNEPKEWTGDGVQVFAIVAFVPGLSGGRNALILGGTGMAGTQCAWNFIADKSQVDDLLHRVGYTGGPLPHFEAVIKSTHVGGNAAESHVVAWRRLDR